MCGIAGILANHHAAELDLAAVAGAMADTLRHRGPDAGAAWADQAAGIAFGHRRLSIIDLSPAGAQPMASACGRFVIAYNGEVYSAAEIRRDLPTIEFRGHSDTEAVLEACTAWGVEKTLSRLIGMFAFAVWDRRDRCLTLARDRMGIKPLYWARLGGAFLFASELKAFHAHPAFRAEVDRDALALFFRLGYIPAPDSIFVSVRKLAPGHVLTVAVGQEPEIRPYWSLRDVARAGAAAPFAGSDEEATDALETLLVDSVQRRMVADVPLGAFLSGGIDSSLVTALMQARASQPVKTYTIAFAEKGFDESEHARGIAHHLGTEHHELPVTARDALDIVPALSDVYDEPFADSSQIPTCLVSRLARRHVTVALTGDGGDELFAGYARYAHAERLGRIGAIPAPLRAAAAGLARGVAACGAGAMAEKSAEILNCDGVDAQFARIVTLWRDTAALVPGAKKLPTAIDDATLTADLPLALDRMLYRDSVTHLVDDILVKVDRASMAVGLEARIPLLDHRVAAFAFSLPDRFRRRDGRGKWLLRRVLARHVPEPLFERPKMGFMIPLAAWLRGELRDWAESLLTPARLAEGGLIRPEPVRRMWREHQSGARDRSSQLWAILMFQTWRERWTAGAAVYVNGTETTQQRAAL